MKKIFLFLMASVGLVAQTPYAHYTGICEQGGIQIVTAAINSTNKALGSFPGCSVLVYNVGTLVTATLYADQGGTFKFNPFTADPTTGRYDFYIAGGFYDIVNYGASIPSGSFTLSSVGIVNPLQPPVFPSLTVTGSSSSTLATITQSGNGYALGVQSVLSGEFINTSSNGDSLVVSMGGTAGHAIVASQNTSVGTATVLISNTGSDPALLLLGALIVNSAGSTIHINSTSPGLSLTNGGGGDDIVSNAYSEFNKIGVFQNCFEGSVGGSINWCNKLIATNQLAWLDSSNTIRLVLNSQAAGPNGVELDTPTILAGPTKPTDFGIAVTGAIGQIADILNVSQNSGIQNLRVDGNGHVILIIPTSCSGLPTGTLINNSGVVNICP